MKRPKMYIFSGITLVILAIFIEYMAITIYPDHCRFFLDTIPASWRSAYINRALNPSPVTNRSMWPMGTTLKALGYDLQYRNNSYNFDYSQLQHLVKTEASGGLGEPFSPYSSFLIIYSGDEKAIRGVYKYYQGDQKTIAAFNSKIEQFQKIEKERYKELSPLLDSILKEANVGSKITR